MTFAIKKQIILFGIMLLTLPAHLIAVEKITFSAQQNDIKLDVVDCTVNPHFYSRQFNTGTPLVPGLGVDDFTKNGMHPIRISIHNASTKPIIIAPNSFRIKLADTKGFTNLFPRGDEFALPFLWNLFGIAYGGGLLFVAEENHYLPFSLSNYPVTSAWTATVVGLSLYMGESLRQDRLKKIQKIEKYFLNKPITIEPGKTAQKLVLLDGASFHSFFQLRVFNHDQTEYVTTFDIELMG